MTKPRNANLRKGTSRVGRSRRGLMVYLPIERSMKEKGPLKLGKIQAGGGRNGRPKRVHPSWNFSGFKSKSWSIAEAELTSRFASFPARSLTRTLRRTGGYRFERTLRVASKNSFYL